MRILRITLISLCLALWLTPLSAPVLAECPGGLVNPGFEEGGYKTEGLGTSLSSSVGVGWTPWSVLGDATINREVEYKVLEAALLPSRNHIHSGNSSQKFFTSFGSHTAGFYQRVAVPRGSKVTFSIWAQIFSGQRELQSGGEFISDLDWPKPGKQDRGPGLYKVSVGIDPGGDTPPGFGAPPSPNTIWSNTVNEFDTRQITESGQQVDAWVLLEISTIARSDHVTVYTKGNPEFPVKHNDSFWDDACLQVSSPPTATPRPATATPEATNTPVASDTPEPTATPVPTETPTLTATAVPTETPLPPTSTPLPTATEVSPTAEPTELAKPTAAPTLRPQPSATAIQPGAGDTKPILGLPSKSFGMVLIYVGIAVLTIVAVLWLRLGDRS